MTGNTASGQKGRSARQTQEIERLDAVHMTRDDLDRYHRLEHIRSIS